MRLESLTLQRYGNYEGERIRFDPTPGVVNILLAPNSAGKSVLRMAFADLLFGIHNQTPMDFRFGYAGMRITAGIIRPNAERATFTRRKTRGNIVVDAEDQPLDTGFLPSLLGDRDRALLERLFVLDTEALREGGRALLESGGDVASALLSAAGGIRQARALKRRLEEQRDERAPTRKTASRPFYQALDTFLESRQRARTAILKPDDQARRERDLKALEDRLRDHNAAADAASSDIARLERIRRVRPALVKLADAMAWLDAHPDAPKLPPHLAAQLTAARLDVAMKEQAFNQARTSLEKATLDAAATGIDATLLAQGDEIERLVGEAGAARKAHDDLPGVTAQHDNRLTRIRDLLRQLGSPLPPDQAIGVVPKTAVQARARELIRAHGEHTGGLRRSDEQIAARRHALARFEPLLAALPPAPDLKSLESLVDSVRADGDPASLRSTAERTVREAEATSRAAQGMVPGWSGTAEALVAIAPLTQDIYVRHEKDVSAAAANVRTAHARSDDETERLTKARAARDAIAGLDSVPDAAALTAARERRDQLWRSIQNKESTDTAAFERAIVDADAIADQRFANAGLVTRIDNARLTILDAEQRVEAAANRLRLTNETLLQTQRAWSQLCASLPLGAEPSLADVQAFRSARDRVIDAEKHRQIAATALSTLDRRQLTHAQLLGRLLSMETQDLPILLTLAERTLARTRQSQAERLKLETQRAQAETELTDALAARSSREASLVSWRERWQAVLTDLGRPDEEEPVATEAVLEITREIAVEHAAAATLAERVEGMNDLIGRFTRSAAVLLNETPEDPFAAIRARDRTLKQERAAEQRGEILKRTLAAAGKDAAAAEQALLAARTASHAIQEMIGAETPEAADQILALALERDGHEARRDDAAADLTASGDGLSITMLRTEADQVPPDELPTRIQTAATARKDASESAQRIAVEANDLRQRMNREEDDTGINTAAADQQAALATLSRTLDEALLYHTASVLLGRALDIVEKSGDSALLRRLDEIFQTLTNGAYARVVTELDDAGKAEFALIQRDFPEERQRIEHLSEGTRDQFFLALRVAAIEDHLNSATPLPFIGDDILQTFDDDRALAALRVMADLSRHTQVVILTHHRHILDLAARLPEGTIFACPREPADSDGWHDPDPRGKLTRTEGERP